MMSVHSIKLASEAVAENAIAGVARLILADRTEPGQKALGMTRLGIDGVLITDEIAFKLGGEFHMLECEIIIVPKKLHSKFKGLNTMRIDQMLTAGYQDENNWKEHKNLESVNKEVKVTPEIKMTKIISGVKRKKIKSK